MQGWRERPHEGVWAGSGDLDLDHLPQQGSVPRPGGRSGSRGSGPPPGPSGSRYPPALPRGGRRGTGSGASCARCCMELTTWKRRSFVARHVVLHAQRRRSRPWRVHEHEHAVEGRPRPRGPPSPGTPARSPRVPDDHVRREGQRRARASRRSATVSRYCRRACSRAASAARMRSEPGLHGQMEIRADARQVAQGARHAGVHVLGMRGREPEPLQALDRVHAREQARRSRGHRGDRRSRSGPAA